MKYDKDKVILILRRLKYEADPLALFTDENDMYDDFDYEESEDGVDGYEVNILESENGGVKVCKKFLDANFIGTRNPGDIGILVRDTPNKSSVSFTCIFNESIRNKYYDPILSYYKRSARIRDILIRSERNNKIDIINE